MRTLEPLRTFFPFGARDACERFFHVVFLAAALRAYSHQPYSYGRVS